MWWVRIRRMDDSELKRLIEGSGEETRRHFDVVAEGLDRKIETVAEGVINLDERITRLDQKVDRKFQEVADQFGETQPMMFPYAGARQEVQNP